MAEEKLSDAEAKEILLNWPRRTSTVWRPPNGKGFWLRGQPKDGIASGPTLSSPGAKLFSTQPDGLWVHFGGRDVCDVVAVEVCGTAQNLNDKRSRYIPSSHSLVLKCKQAWFLETIKTRGGGSKSRWKAAGTLTKPRRDVSIPVRHLRVLYALPNALYSIWCPEHVPTGYEFFCPHSSLDSYNSPKMQTFLGQMSMASQFYKRVARG